MSIEAPSRGLIGFRSLLLTATRGTALMHQHHAGWIPWVGDLPGRKGGAMIADRTGTTTGYALDNLQARGEFFIGPGEPVYEGMVVGENAKPDDMIVNVVREKQKTNIRTHAADEAIKLTPPRVLTLETAIEFIADDELVEVTPRACGCASGCCAGAGPAPPEALGGQSASRLEAQSVGGALSRWPGRWLVPRPGRGRRDPSPPWRCACRPGRPGGPRPDVGSGSCRRSGTSTSS